MKYFYRPMVGPNLQIIKDVAVVLHRVEEKNGIWDRWDRNQNKWVWDEWLLWEMGGMGGNSVPYVRISKARAVEIIAEWENQNK